jgi:hypothetical protein
MERDGGGRMTHTTSAEGRIARASNPSAAPPRKLRSQSAMEYLMTYGWAILIIAVVLGALFQLGVFNGATFAPKAPPGACQVFRPNGPGTAFNLNLEGVCNGELPEYAAVLTPPSNIPISNNPSIQTNSITIVAWINWYGSTGAGWQNIVSKQGSSWSVGDVEYGMGLQIYSSTYPNPNALEVWGCNSQINEFTYVAPIGTWVQAAGTISPSPSNSANSITTAYVDANPLPFATPQGYNNLPCSGSHPLYISNGGNFNGQIANVQIYNTSLSTNEIQALYQEGIGGAPIDLQNLVGWWPLNGNANDYSGNENNGVPSTNVVFTSSWTSGYTTP